MSEFVKSQQELRANLTAQIQETLDSAEERCGLDQEALNKVNAIEAEIRSADDAIAVAQRQEERKNEANEAARGFVPVEAREERSAGDILRDIAKGEIRGHEFESRATLVPSTNTVPKSFFAEVMDVARLVGPMLEVSDVINTTTGEDLTIPTLTAYSTASLKGAGAALDESEPTYSSITLGAFKYGVLIPVAAELITDAGFNIETHIAQQAGNALGTVVNAALSTDNGSSKPNGIVTASSAGVTGATGVTGAFTADNLIDLAYTGVDGLVRRLPGTGYMASGTAIGAMRKLKDTAGNYLYNVGIGQPDSFAGFPVIENPDISVPAVSAKSVLFGYFKSYKVRMAGGLQVASSADYAFNTDTVTYRVTMRADGDLTHSGHVRHFVGGAS